MGCSDCELLRRYGYDDRICGKCAEKFGAMAKRLGEAMRKQRDKIFVEAFAPSRPAAPDREKGGI